MKIISIKYMMLFAFAMVFAACSSDGEVRHLGVTAVKALYEPDNGKAVVLQASASASLYFEWEPSLAEDGGAVLYEVVFDKADGDFSDPVSIVTADNNGGTNHATITHKQLNQIAASAGIGSAEEGTLKWTVYASKGINPVKAEEERTLTLTRLAGFAEVPIDVYVTGEASEGGVDLAKAHKMKAVAGGEFEVYTKLAAGKPFYFTDGKTGTPREFYTADGMVKENGTTTVAKDGVYRITLDFNTGACTYTLVNKITFYFCPDGESLFELPYVGYGVFQAKETVTFKQESWGRDERYKFRMTIRENGGADAEKEVDWGTLNQTDSRPTASSPESYYYLQLFTEVSQWDNKWKLMGDFDGVPATYTVYLTADQPYTHTIVK